MDLIDNEHQIHSNTFPQVINDDTKDETTVSNITSTPGINIAVQDVNTNMELNGHPAAYVIFNTDTNKYKVTEEEANVTTDCIEIMDNIFKVPNSVCKLDEKNTLGKLIPCSNKILGRNNDVKEPIINNPNRIIESYVCSSIKNGIISNRIIQTNKFSKETNGITMNNLAEHLEVEKQIVGINTTLNNDRNNYDMEQRGSLITNTNEAQHPATKTSLSNEAVSDIEENEGLEKYLKFNKRPAKDRKERFDDDDDQCEKTAEKVDANKEPVFEPENAISLNGSIGSYPEEVGRETNEDSRQGLDADDEMSLKGLIGLYSEEVRREMDADSQPANFSTPSLDDTHLEFPEGEDGNHICEHCSNKFPTEYDLVTHTCKKRPSNDFSEFNKLLKKRRVLSPDPFASEIEDDLEKNGKTVKEAMKKDGGGYQRRGVDTKPVPCPYCGKLISRRSGLKVHIRRHLDTKPYQCEFCEKGFVVLYDLDRHMMRMHVGKQKFRLRCEICKRPFVSKDGLIQHKRIAHKGFAAYVCKICDMPFNQEYRLKRHMGEHEEEDAIDESLELMEIMERGEATNLETLDVTSSSVGESLDEIDLSKSNTINDSPGPISLDQIELDTVDLDQTNVECDPIELMESINSDIEDQTIQTHGGLEREARIEPGQSGDRIEEPLKVDLSKSIQLIPLNSLKPKTDLVPGNYVTNQSPVLINLNQTQSTVPPINYIPPNQIQLLNVSKQVVENKTKGLINLQGLTDGPIKLLPSKQIKLIDLNQSIAIEKESISYPNIIDSLRTAQLIPSSQVEIEFVHLSKGIDEAAVPIKGIDINKSFESDKLVNIVPPNQIEIAQIPPNRTEIERVLPDFIEVEQNLPNQIEFEQVPPNPIEIQQVPPNQIEIEQFLPNQIEIDQISLNQIEIEQIPPNRTEIEQTPLNHTEIEQVPPNRTEIERVLPNLTEIEQNPRNQIEFEQVPPTPTEIAQTPLNQTEIEHVPLNQIEIDQVLSTVINPTMDCLELTNVNEAQSMDISEFMPSNEIEEGVVDFDLNELGIDNTSMDILEYSLDQL